MTIKKITDFNFPVGKTQLSQDAYYRALSAVDSGFYPFSENGLWHGGIHINGAVLKKINGDDKLRCMANGEVIAYRVNDVYPKIVYDDIKPTILSDILQEVVYFSSGFTLVRHYLSMPEIEDSTEVPPSITLYSLYMHQLDWYGYQQRKQNNNVNVEHPAYWQIDKGEVNTETSETIKGTAIRENGSNTTVIGLLLKGSKVRLGEQHKKMLGWYKIVSITEGTLVTLNEFKTQLGNITGYVWRGDIGNKPTGKNAEVDKDYEICKEDNEKIGEQEVEVKGIAVYSTASETTKLTYLPQSATFEFDGQENGYAKIRKISNCEVPATLVMENGSDNAPHKGYIKLTALNLTEFKPEKLDKIVVLKKPFPINVGNFIGYIGHNVSQSKCIDDQKEFPLSNMKRKLDSQLPQLAHIELFTCDDLPVFINKTRALADKLPKTKKTILLVEKGARLIQSPKPTGFLPVRVGIKFISDKSHYYVKVKLEYTLLLLSSTSPSISFDTTKITINGINDNTQNKSDEMSKHRLIFDDKNYLVNQYKKDFPELTITDIPDEVELVNNNNTLLSNTTLTIRFVVENKHYWIASKDVLHLNEQDGLLTSQIQYWNKFPLALDNLPAATEYNIVDYPRTVLLNSESFTAVDDNAPDSVWRYVETVNKKNQPIQGWVNTKTGVQEYIKLVTPWHWPIFKTVEETATLSELSNKIDENKIGQLALAGYTPVMKELHDIIKNSFLYLGNSNKSPLPPFTNAYLKSVLNTSWTAEQLGHLLIKYESEWYADESLSKWDEMNGRFDDQKQQKKDKIEKELIKKNLTQPYQRDFAMQKVDEAHEYIKTNCQLEKEQRIKPSLWWKKVAEAQSANTNQTDANTNTPKRSNLSTDGKAWFIHPVAMQMFKSTNELLTIVIDPGHGYLHGDTGSAARRYSYKIKNKEFHSVNVEELPQLVIDNTKLITESEEDWDRNERGLVFDVSIKLKQLLDVNGYNVILTRNERKIEEGIDDSETRQARVELANKCNADYFISIHADGTVGYTASGAHVIYPKTQNQEVTTLSKELAKDILNYYKVVPVQLDSPKEDIRNLRVIRDDLNQTKRKILVELGFISSPKDAKALFSNIDLIAQQLYKGLMKNIQKYY